MWRRGGWRVVDGQEEQRGTRHGGSGDPSPPDPRRRRRAAPGGARLAADRLGDPRGGAVFRPGDLHPDRHRPAALLRPRAAGELPAPLAPAAPRRRGAHRPDDPRDRRGARDADRHPGRRPCGGRAPLPHHDRAQARQPAPQPGGAHHRLRRQYRPGDPQRGQHRGAAEARAQTRSLGRAAPARAQADAGRDDRHAAESVGNGEHAALAGHAAARHHRHRLRGAALRADAAGGPARPADPAGGLPRPPPHHRGDGRRRQAALAVFRGPARPQHRLRRGDRGGALPDRRAEPGPVRDRLGADALRALSRRLPLGPAADAAGGGDRAGLEHDHLHGDPVPDPRTPDGSGDRADALWPVDRPLAHRRAGLGPVLDVAVGAGRASALDAAHGLPRGARAPCRTPRIPRRAVRRQARPDARAEFLPAHPGRGFRGGAGPCRTDPPALLPLLVLRGRGVEGPRTRRPRRGAGGAYPRPEERHARHALRTHRRPRRPHGRSHRGCPQGQGHRARRCLRGARLLQPAAGPPDSQRPAGILDPRGRGALRFRPGLPRCRRRGDPGADPRQAGYRRADGALLRDRLGPAYAARSGTGATHLRRLHRPWGRAAAPQPADRPAAAAHAERAGPGRPMARRGDRAPAGLHPRCRHHRRLPARGRGGGLGQGDHAVLPGAIRPGGQGAGRLALRSGHGGRPGGGGRPAGDDRQGLSRPRHPRRGIRHRAGGRGMRLGARSHRRHPRLHRRPAELGHPDRPDPPRRASARADAPALSRGDLHRGRPHRRLRGPAGERTLRTRRCADLSHALLATTDPRLFAEGEEATRFRTLEGQVRLSRYGADCYAYCMLAAGQVDLVVEAGLKPYDICALIPIIEGAGGRITAWDGGSAAQGGRVVAAGDPRLHEAALKANPAPAEAPRFDPATRAVSNWQEQTAESLWPRALALTASLARNPPYVARCVRLNNGWCIKSARWPGEIGADGEGHTAFATLADGADAAARLLRRYYRDYDRRSALAIVRRWAPSECRIAATPGRASVATPAVSATLAPKGIGKTLRARFLARHRPGGRRGSRRGGPRRERCGSSPGRGSGAIPAPASPRRVRWPTSPPGSDRRRHPAPARSRTPPRCSRAGGCRARSGWWRNRPSCRPLPPGCRSSTCACRRRFVRATRCASTPMPRGSREASGSSPATTCTCSRRTARPCRTSPRHARHVGGGTRHAPRRAGPRRRGHRAAGAGTLGLGAAIDRLALATKALPRHLTPAPFRDSPARGSSLHRHHLPRRLGPACLRRGLPGPPRPADPAPRRHRPRPLGQDRVHHGADPPSRGDPCPAGLRRRAGGTPAPRPPRAAARRRRAALPLRGAFRDPHRGPRLAALHRPDQPVPPGDRL
ncbi:hypothetical protein Lal_00041057 [Lupinus albus]|nr:hypothetical protein Lal_00041057 [Lupinus albus]